jgi:hypothetical protein
LPLRTDLLQVDVGGDPGDVQPAGHPVDRALDEEGTALFEELQHDESVVAAHERWLASPGDRGVDEMVMRLADTGCEVLLPCRTVAASRAQGGVEGRAGRLQSRAAAAAERRGGRGYGLTAVIAVDGARRLVADGAPAGALAPAQAFDATDFLDALARTASPGRPF